MRMALLFRLGEESWQSVRMISNPGVFCWFAWQNVNVSGVRTAHWILYPTQERRHSKTLLRFINNGMVIEYWMKLKVNGKEIWCWVSDLHSLSCSLTVVTWRERKDKKNPSRLFQGCSIFYSIRDHVIANRNSPSFAICSQDLPDPRNQTIRNWHNENLWESENKGDMS